jgi:hypothetical protein
MIKRSLKKPILVIYTFALMTAFQGQLFIALIAGAIGILALYFDGCPTRE